jgi:hypothetical protein
MVTIIGNRRRIGAPADDPHRASPFTNSAARRRASWSSASSDSSESAAPGEGNSASTVRQFTV